MCSQSDGVCGCRSRIGFMQDPSEVEEWWVCAECGLPTRVYLEAAYAAAMVEAQ